MFRELLALPYQNTHEVHDEQRHLGKLPLIVFLQVFLIRTQPLRRRSGTLCGLKRCIYKNVSQRYHLAALTTLSTAPGTTFKKIDQRRLFQPSMRSSTRRAITKSFWMLGAAAGSLGVAAKYVCKSLRMTTRYRTWAPESHSRARVTRGASHT